MTAAVVYPFPMSPRTAAALLLLLVIAAVEAFGLALATAEAPLPPREVDREGYRCVHDTIAAAQGLDSLTYVTVKQNTHRMEAPTSVTGVSSRGGRPASTYTVVPAGEAVAAADGEDAWRPLRIRAFYEDLLNPSRYCTAVGQQRPDFGGSLVSCSSGHDILTEKKRSILVGTILPNAIGMHMDRLKVVPSPAGSSIVVSGMPGRWCSSFTIPSSHRTSGVSDADFLVYIAAGPTSTPDDFIAWATGCQFFPVSERPAVGAIYFNPRYLTEELDETAGDIASGGNAYSRLDSLIRVAAHELLHALGFSYSAFHRAGMLSTVPSLREKPAVTVINSPAVRNAATRHYGCNEANGFPGMELEDEGAAGTSGSHWKRRNARDELMSPVTTFLRYTALTLAAMEDLGYYKVNYDKAEYMGWGNGVGCAMLTKKCITSSPAAVTPTVPSVFCWDETLGGRQYCTRDRLRIGRCFVTTYSSSLPAHMQYFTNPVLGGGERFMDYCPTVQAYSNTACSDDTVSVVPGSVAGNTARCFDADPAAPLVVRENVGRPHVVCALVHCNYTTKVYHVWFRGGGESYVECVPGATVEPASTSPGVFQSGGRVRCPSFDEVCSANTRAGFALPPSDEADAARRPDSPVFTVLVVLLVLLLPPAVALL